MQAADVAVSQSNRKINGQLVSSIAPTDDRPMHHRSGQHPAPSPSTLPDPLDFRSQLCNAYARAGLGPDHLPSAALQQSLPTQNVWPGPPSLAPSMEACMVCHHSLAMSCYLCVALYIPFKPTDLKQLWGIMLALPLLSLLNGQSPCHPNVISKLYS